MLPHSSLKGISAAAPLELKRHFRATISEAAALELKRHLQATLPDSSLKAVAPTPSLLEEPWARQ